MAETSREKRARALAEHGTIAAAVAAGAMAQFDDLTLSEAIVLGLYNQGVRKYVGILGHGTTDIGLCGCGRCGMRRPRPMRSRL